MDSFISHKEALPSLFTSLLQIKSPSEGRGVQGSPFVYIHFQNLIAWKSLFILLIMYGKNQILESLRKKASEIREWLMEHSSPDTSAEEFCKVANDYAIICTKI